MMFLIIATSPTGGAFRHGLYEDKDVAERICRRLNELDIPYVYVVREVKG